MILLLIWCLLVSPLGSRSSQETTAQLPPAIIAELDEQFPGWQFSPISAEVHQYLRGHSTSAQPALIAGDFNEDGQTDYATLIIHSNFENRGGSFSHLVETLAFLRRGEAYDLSFLTEAAPATPELYLMLASKGAAGYDFSARRRFRYAADAIVVSYFEKASTAYVYEAGRFRSIITSD